VERATDFGTRPTVAGAVLVDEAGHRDQPSGAISTRTSSAERFIEATRCGRRGQQQQQKQAAMPTGSSTGSRL
jgi:hypothetical protein